MTAWLSGDGSGVMAAYVVKGAQLAVGSAHGKNRLACKFSREEVAGICDLIDAAYDLPVAAKDLLLLQALDCRFEIPGRWDGMRLCEWGGVIVERQQGFEIGIHPRVSCFYSG